MSRSAEAESCLKAFCLRRQCRKTESSFSFLRAGGVAVAAFVRIFAALAFFRFFRDFLRVFFRAGKEGSGTSFDGLEEAEVDDDGELSKSAVRICASVQHQKGSWFLRKKRGNSGV